MNYAVSLNNYLFPIITFFLIISFDRGKKRVARVAAISNHRDNRKVRFSPFYSDIM